MKRLFGKRNLIYLVLIMEIEIHNSSIKLLNTNEPQTHSNFLRMGIEFEIFSLIYKKKTEI